MSLWSASFMHVGHGQVSAVCLRASSVSVFDCRDERTED